MGYRKKTWQEKLKDKENLPKILKLEKKFPCYNAVHKMGAEVGDRVVLVNPSEIIRIMKNVPKGKCITSVEICKKIASRHKVEACCTLTTGIFIMAAANAAEEGKGLDIPYWRTLKADGFLNEKYPGGIEAQTRELKKEGFTVVRKGKRCYVKDYQKRLYRPR